MAVDGTMTVAVPSGSGGRFSIEPVIPPGDQDAGGRGIAQLAGVAQDGMGNLFVSDAKGNMVLKIDQDGNRSVVAGTGEAGYDGDGGDALQARLKNPQGLAVDASGALLIADEGNNVIRRVNPDGSISTIAGAAPGARRDELSVESFLDAWQARLMAPRTIAVNSDGSVYITENPCADGPRAPTSWKLRPRS